MRATSGRRHGVPTGPSRLPIADRSRNLHARATPGTSVRPPVASGGRQGRSMTTRHLLALFDSIYVLAMAAMVGSIVFFSFVVAPIIFRVLGAEGGRPIRPRLIPPVLSLGRDLRGDRAAGVSSPGRSASPNTGGSSVGIQAVDAAGLHPDHALRRQLAGTPDQSGPRRGAVVARSLRAAASPIRAAERRWSWSSGSGCWSPSRAVPLPGPRGSSSCRRSSGRDRPGPSPRSVAGGDRGGCVEPVRRPSRIDADWRTMTAIA